MTLPPFVILFVYPVCRKQRPVSRGAGKNPVSWRAEKYHVSRGAGKNPVSAGEQKIIL
jgi:hypothetical protein